MNAMTRYLAVGMVQAQAARLLGTLAFGNDVFRRRAGEQRAMQCLAAALHVHLSDEVLVLHVFTAVTNLAHGSYENRCRFMECNGIQTLVQAMQMYLASAKLQCQGCWAMLTLAGSDEVAEGIMQAQGDRAVVQALLQHRYELRKSILPPNNLLLICTSLTSVWFITVQTKEFSSTVAGHCATSPWQVKLWPSPSKRKEPWRYVK